MSPPQAEGGLERALAPWPLLLGVVVSFVGCCALGRILSRQNPYHEFERFHTYINPMTLYYPTASQTRAIARSRLRPDQVAVVVGGSSVLYGWGLGGEGVWARQLQARLGGRYRVFNFAMCGAAAGDFGTFAAEALEHRGHRKVILVTNTWPGTRGSAGDADGGHPNYWYFFWDAYWKGLLTRGRAREGRLAELAREKKDDVAYAELKRRARLDGWLHYQDLWTTVAYRWASTVWCPQVARSFTRPRRSYPDEGGANVPLSLRYPAAQDEMMRANLSQVFPLYRWQGVPAGDPDPDYSGSPLVRTFKLCVPPEFRKRTLVLVTHISPHYVALLPPDLQAEYAANFPETVRALEQAGFAALELGKGYTSLDFNDSCHISPEGAPRMAAEVAAKVRQLAGELGYAE